MGKVMFLKKGDVHTSPKKSGITTSELAIGSTVYLNENGSKVEYLVVNHGIPSSSSLYDSSCNGLWLLRKNIYTTMAWDSSDNDYKNSDVHTYLNSTFLEIFDTDTQAAIVQAKIPYYDGTGSDGTNKTEGDSLSTKIFLLSNYEVGRHTFPYSCGACLEYFSNYDGEAYDPNRIAYYNGEAINWFLRTPGERSSDEYVSICLSSGYTSTTCTVTSSCGVRPALILPNTTIFDIETFIFKEVK